MQGFTLDRESIDQLRAMLLRYKQADRMPIGRADGPRITFSPSVFAALTPPGGIPAATGGNPTATPPVPPTVNYATCAIYALTASGYKDLKTTAPVSNAYTSSSSPAVGVGGSKWVMIGKGSDGTYFVLGEPC